VKQCPKGGGNLADFVSVCPYCGAAVAVAQAAQFAAQPEFSGPPESSGKALASLICGVVFFFWPLTAVAAVVLGHLALSDIKRSARAGSAGVAWLSRAW
jgi:hypothetical protein